VLIRPAATGSAGLINTISMFSKSHILAGVFGALSAVGWILQAAGGGILYKRVSRRVGHSTPLSLHRFQEPSHLLLEYDS
jgi:hypothetical protein